MHQFTFSFPSGLRKQTYSLIITSMHRIFNLVRAMMHIGISRALVTSFYSVKLPSYSVLPKLHWWLCNGYTGFSWPWVSCFVCCSDHVWLAYCGPKNRLPFGGQDT